MDPNNELQKNQSFVGDIVSFLGENKKWWLVPVVVVIALVGVLIALGGTAAAPFIYSLF